MTDEKYIKEATAHSEELLRSQLARCEKMAGDSGKTDFAALDKTVIGICDGDGIGPIIMKQAEKLLSESALNVREIAVQVGYLDEKYFSRLFKKKTGLKPTEYRRIYG